MRLWLAGFLIFLSAAAFPITTGAQRSAEMMLPPRDVEMRFVCATDDDRARVLRLRPTQAIAQGRLISFRQEPAILMPDQDAAVTLREFTVLGDVATIRFKLNMDDSAVESFTRSATRTMAGRLVSVFTPSWPASTLARVLNGQRWGWDQPQIYWGEFLHDGAAPGDGLGVRLRISPTSLPRVRVTRLASDVQYSSHVVNIALPNFASGFPENDHGFDFAAVTRKFYEFFEDSYDSIAMSSADIYAPLGYSAFHRNIQNRVRGINLPLFDDSAAYSSAAHRLQSVEMFVGANLTDSAVSSHEIAHQWGDYLDWRRLTGIRRAGHQPESHDPLWDSGETLLGAVLGPTRRVVHTPTGWAIDQAAPVHFHPYTLYAMGVIGRDQVPQVTLFDDQDQFSATAATSPAPGTAVSGTTRTATVYNVIGMAGEREGPVLSEWSRATVIVSRELLSQREMDYWTFFAQRLDDPNKTGIVGWQGVGSFETATSQRIDLRTDIRPRTAAQIIEPLPVDYPVMGRRDWRDVLFDAPVATHYKVGERLRWSGVIVAPDRSDFDQITIRFRKVNDTAETAIRMAASVSSASSFIVQGGFAPNQRGVYTMDVFLFWPGSGVQSSRMSLSPITVD